MNDTCQSYKQRTSLFLGGSDEVALVISVANTKCPVHCGRHRGNPCLSGTSGQRQALGVESMTFSVTGTN